MAMDTVSSLLRGRSRHTAQQRRDCGGLAASGEQAGSQSTGTTVGAARASSDQSAVHQDCSMVGTAVAHLLPRT